MFTLVEILLNIAIITLLYRYGSRVDSQFDGHSEYGCDGALNYYDNDLRIWKVLMGLGHNESGSFNSHGGGL